MIGSVVQVRVDEGLKKEVTKIYESLGLDISSAVRMFFTRSVQVGGIPFSMSNEKLYNRDSAVENILMARKDSIDNGTSDITLEEINSQIDSYRSGN